MSLKNTNQEFLKIIYFKSNNSCHSLTSIHTRLAEDKWTHFVTKMKKNKQKTFGFKQEMALPENTLT